MSDFTQIITISIKSADEENVVSLTRSPLKVPDVIEWLPAAFYGLDFAGVGDELKEMISK